MRTLLIGFFIITVSFVQGQLSGYYYFRTSNKDVDCGLSLYKNGSYVIELGDDGELPILYATLSYGTYSLSNNGIILKDVNHGFTLKLNHTAPFKALYVEKGFVFLLNKTGYEFGETYEYEFEQKIGIDSIIQKKEREAYQQLYKDSYPHSLYLGIYESENNCQPNQRGEWEKGYDYELNIQENFQYTLHYNRILILQGTWKRVGNELALYDESLQHSFYLLIGRDGLISKYLPGEYRGSILKWNPKCCGKILN